MVYVKQAMTSTLLLAVVAIFSHLIMLTYFYIYSNLALTYISMLQIFDNDYVTLTLFSRSFKYIFSKLESDHTSSSAYWISFPPNPPRPSFPLTYIVLIDNISLV